ncbi:MAG: hypothetical protein ACP6IY_00970 [Promethearchaeia archaeon]
MALNRFNTFYIVGLVITSLLMLWILLFGVTSLYASFLIFFYTLKFLSGFGLILAISNGFLILFDKTKDKLGESSVKILIIIEIIIPILLIIYAVYKVISSYYGSGGLTMQGIWAEIYVWIDLLIYIYGILSLLIQLYLIPLAKGTFDEAINQERVSKWGSNLKNFGRNIKKKWFKMRGSIAKAQLQDQKTIKEHLAIWRNRFAVILLVPLAIGAFIFTPILFIFIVFWFKIIVFNRSQIYNFEKIALFISIIIIGAIAVITPFIELGIYSSIQNLMWSINIFYLIGIIVATLIFVIKLLELEGFSLENYRRERLKRKKENLKRQTKELKKELKTVKKGSNKKEINNKDSNKRVKTNKKSKS